MKSKVFKGRGAVSNADNRYETFKHEAFDDGWDIPEDERSAPKTEVIKDSSRKVIAHNSSPDIPFDQSINPYRGCEHGCVYCYARPTHAYLGFSPGLDFETKILVKPEAAKLLRNELASPRYKCRELAMGTNTDPYQPLERKLKITRSILELLNECSHPFTIVTKSALILRDLDLIAPMSHKNLCHVFMSIPTLNEALSRKLEPRTASPKRRLAVLQTMREQGVSAGVIIAPVIPKLTDTEIETILEKAAAAGALSANYILLRLPLEIKDLFYEWLQEHEPLAAEHVMSLMRQMRGGKAYQSDFKTRRSGTGNFADLLKTRFMIAKKRLNLVSRMSALDNSLFVPPSLNGQIRLF